MGEKLYVASDTLGPFVLNPLSHHLDDTGSI